MFIVFPSAQEAGSNILTDWWLGQCMCTLRLMQSLPNTSQPCRQASIQSRRGRLERICKVSKIVFPHSSVVVLLHKSSSQWDLAAAYSDRKLAPILIIPLTLRGEL